MADLFGHLLNKVVGNAGAALGEAIGDSVGDALGNAVGKVTSQAADNITTDMKIASETKQMILEEQQKVNDLPDHCPHCKAPTNKQLVCEYCHCKIVE